MENSDKFVDKFTFSIKGNRNKFYGIGLKDMGVSPRSFHPAKKSSLLPFGQNS